MNQSSVMSHVKRIEYRPRVCDGCGGNDLESLWEYSKLTRTVDCVYEWQVRNVICKACGFVFVSPAPQDKSLEEYYSGTFADLQGQRLDYSIQKRVDLMAKHLKGRANVSYVEIGGSSNNTAFTQALPSCISSIKHFEINANSHRDGDKITSSDRADIIVAYFVLEHIPSPKEFLASCYQSLNDGGILIIEVPNLEIYPVDPSGLILWEHTNHFSPRSLSCLASAQGFAVEEISYVSCSRPFGFAAVFKKTPAAKPIASNYSDYLIAKSSMLGGLAKVQEYPRKLQAARDRINAVAAQNGRVIIWAANAVCLQLLENYTLPSQAMVVDSNPDRKNYLGSTQAHQPLNVVDDIKAAKLLVINTRIHSEDILKFIADKIGREFKSSEVIVIDNF